MYTFKSVRLCELSGRTGSLVQISPSLMDWLEINPDFDIRKRIDLELEDGKIDYNLEFIESRDSGHGMMQIFSDSKLQNDSQGFQMTSI